MIIQKTLPILLLALFVIPLTHAQGADKIEVYIDLDSAGAASQRAVFYFTTPLLTQTNYTLDGIVRDVIVTANGQIDFNVVKNVIEIFPKAPVNVLMINYTADNAVFHSNSVNYFFTEFNFDKETNISAQIKLPQGFVIYQNNYKPLDATLASDGSRIILLWNETNEKNILFSVKYQDYNDAGFFWFLLAIFLVIFIIFVIFLFFHFKKKNKEAYNEAFMKGFRNDEQRAIQYIEQKKTVFQRDMQRDLNFSRAKATRIVMRLEEKGIVHKKHYGRTNKLSWIQK